MWTSGRHGFLLPLGLPSEPSVRNANMISIRTAALVEISLCLDHEILVEQPDHPRGLISLPRWQTIAAHTTLYRTRCKQGAYQAQTPKPTALYSNHIKWTAMLNEMTEQDVERMARNPNDLVTRKRDSQGRVRLTGKREPLKATQAYTSTFGAAIAEAWKGSCVPQL